jgi:hypothetical protein
MKSYRKELWFNVPRRRVQTFAGSTSEQIDSLWHMLLQIRENLGQRIQLMEASDVK